MLEIIIIAIVICFTLLMIAQYRMFDEMKKDLTVELVHHVDEFMRTVHFKSLQEVNRMGMMSDAKKLEQIEEIIKSAIELKDRIRNDD